MSGLSEATSPERKSIPLARGVLDYFPDALVAVAEVSRKGNDKHNPGEELHHARGKSSDHADCIVRHLLDRGGFDAEGVRHSASVAWRALALLQEELEEAGAPLARGAVLPTNREFERTPRRRQYRDQFTDRDAQRALGKVARIPIATKDDRVVPRDFGGAA